MCSQISLLSIGGRLTRRKMILTDEQVKKFKEAFESAGASFDGYTESDIREIANGAMNIYGTLVDVNLRIKREEAEGKKKET